MKQNAIKLKKEDLPTKVILEGRNNDLEEINLNKTKQNRKSECHEPREKSYTTSRIGFWDLLNNSTNNPIGKGKEVSKYEEMCYLR